MTTTATRVDEDRHVFVKESLQVAREQDRCEALDKSSVAELSAAMIDEMTCDELVRVIRASELPRQPCFDFQRRLPLYDRATLRRLAVLARRCCQNQGY